MSLAIGIEPEGSAYDDGSTPTVRARVRANRGLLVIAAIVVLVAVLIALTQAHRTIGLLDPDAANTRGSKAVATLLSHQGVSVVRVTTAAQAGDAVRQVPGATLVVAPAPLMSSRMADQVSQATRIVLLDPSPDVLDYLAPWAQPSGFQRATDDVVPGCAWDVAQRAGGVPAAATQYTTQRTDVASCWGATVLDAPSDGRNPATTVVGYSDAFTNEKLADSGNAALALGTLGRSATVVWWMPSASDPLQFEQGSDPTISDYVPSWVGWAFLQLALAMVVVVWWRARRMGRIVLEPLPVVVRATETVEGRARLYRRGRARGRAADALRNATLGRLRSRLSLPRSADVPTVVAAVGARTGRPETEIATLLTPGSDPADDAGLTRLANALDALENEVRHP
jgi:hypothetical protein